MASEYVLGLTSSRSGPMAGSCYHGNEIWSFLHGGKSYLDLTYCIVLQSYEILRLLFKKCPFLFIICIVTPLQF
jgi:hypothetical protein